MRKRADECSSLEAPCMFSAARKQYQAAASSTRILAKAPVFASGKDQGGTIRSCELADRDSAHSAARVAALQLCL